MLAAQWPDLKLPDYSIAVHKETVLCFFFFLCTSFTFHSIKIVQNDLEGDSHRRLRSPVAIVKKYICPQLRPLMSWCLDEDCDQLCYSCSELSSGVFL